MLSSSHPAPIETSRGFSKPPEAKEEPMLSFRGTQTFLLTGRVHQLSRSRTGWKENPAVGFLAPGANLEVPGVKAGLSSGSSVGLRLSQRSVPCWSIPKLSKNIKSTVTLDPRNLWEWVNAPKMPASPNCEIVRLYKEFVYMKFSHITELYTPK